MLLLYDLCTWYRLLNTYIHSISVFAEVLSRVLDLEMEDLEPGDSQMVVTVFQYAAYFLSRGG